MGDELARPGPRASKPPVEGLPTSRTIARALREVRSRNGPAEPVHPPGGHNGTHRHDRPVLVRRTAGRPLGRADGSWCHAHGSATGADHRGRRGGLGREAPRADAAARARRPHPSRVRASPRPPARLSEIRSRAGRADMCIPHTTARKPARHTITTGPPTLAPVAAATHATKHRHPPVAGCGPKGRWFKSSRPDRGKRLKGFEPSTFCMATRACGVDSR
jgi:hypothetical protein